MLNPILRKFIYSSSQIRLTKPFNTDVDVGKYDKCKKKKNRSTIALKY